MKSSWGVASLVSTGLLTSISAWGQYTISARPGAVNYVEGSVSINGSPLTSKSGGRTFLATNDSISTQQGEAEVLLTPGVFVRIGNDSTVKMVSPRLTDTEVEVTRGEAIVEVAEFVKDDNLKVLDAGSTVQIKKVGLYLFKVDPATVRVFDGKASTAVAGKDIEIGKGHELALANSTKAQHFDKKQSEDDLYAWSQVRDQYVSAASYASANTVRNVNSFDGFGGWYGPGWMWNSGFNSWAWLPGDGAYFSPFGFGYYSPGYVGYAPVVYAPVLVGGGGGGTTTTGKRPVAIPVNPTKPVAVAGGSGHPVYPGGGRFNGNWPATFGSGASHVSSNTFANRGYVSGSSMSRSSGATSSGRMSSGGGGGSYSPSSGGARSMGASGGGVGSMSSHGGGAPSSGGGRGK